MPDYAQPKAFSPTRIAVIGNYLPRQCGIATFTTDLCDALTAGHAAPSLFAVAVTDVDAAYDYLQRVRFELKEEELASYREAADFLNFSNVDLVCLQHEYGIFGGDAGSHILWLLRSLKMPVVTTLHTVLRDPNPAQRQVMEELATLSDRLIVMSEHSSQFLRDIYHVPAAKIDLIPHGVPDLPFVDPNFYKAAVGAEARDVILTFGLLSPNKGIENVIRAMPSILERHKNAMYIVAGATHPHIRRREGDRYRESLQALAEELGVKASVAFHNRFVSPAELVEFRGSADLYVTPYRAEAQVVSGTLAYALSAGKAIIRVLLKISRQEMLHVLRDEHAFSDVFVRFLLTRNARIQGDLMDQLFNSSEKRLARVLLLLAQFGKQGKPETVIPKLSQETLAEMVGTTRSRISFFMNRFRKLGFVEYDRDMRIHSLLNVVLHD